MSGCLYPVGLTVDGVKNVSARALYKYLAGLEAKGALEKYGFEVG